MAFLGVENNLPQFFIAVDFNADSIKNNEERNAREYQKVIESGMAKEVSKNVLVSTVPNLPMQFYCALIDNTMYIMDEALGNKLIRVAISRSRPATSVLPLWQRALRSLAVWSSTSSRWPT